MKFHSAAITILLISIVAMSATSYISNLGEYHSTTADFQGLENVQYYMNKTSTDMEARYNEFSEFTMEESDVSALVVVYRMIQFGVQGIKQIFFSWTFIGDFINILNSSLPDGLKLPAWFWLGISGMVTTLVVAMLIYAFIKWKVET